MVALSFVFSYAVKAQLFPHVGLVAGILGVLLLWAKIVVPVKRLHDANRTGWWMLLGVLVIVGAVISAGFTAMFSVISLEELQNGVEPDMEAIEAALENGVASTQLMIGKYGGLVLTLALLLFPASEGANKYGADPRDGDGLGFGS